MIAIILASSTNESD